jgi:hypothetical protein
MPNGGFESHFWNWAGEATNARAEKEGWTRDDCDAALFQASLLSYSSHPKSSEVYGDRYVCSAPDDYEHNAPWNDWVPPSRSRERSREAIANKRPELIDQRVRVRICASADAAGLENSVIAFADVEVGSDGRKNLRLRRGADVLASMTVRSVTVVQLINGRFVALSPVSSTRTRQRARCSVYLAFEGEARKSKFCDMMEEEKM